MKLTLQQTTVEGVISGGQTGADRGGLDAGLDLGLAVGGYVPRGRRAEDGRVPARYASMVEHPRREYSARTTANIAAADVTLVFCSGPPTGGSAFTVRECTRLEKACLVVDLQLDDEAAADVIRTWLSTQAPRIINVAGRRESKIPGIQARVRCLLVAALKSEEAA